MNGTSVTRPPAQHPENATYQRLRRQEKKRRGECLYCTADAASNSLYCTVHKKKVVQWSTAGKKRRRRRGLCIDCAEKAVRKGRCLLHIVYVMWKADVQRDGSSVAMPSARRLQRWTARRIREMQKKIDFLKPFCKEKDLWPTKLELRSGK